MQSLKHGMGEFRYYGTSMGKQRQFPGSALPYRFRVSGNSCNLQCLGICEFPCNGNIQWKVISLFVISKLEVIRKIRQS